MKKTEIQVVDRRTLTHDEQDQAWALYTNCGNAAMVAREMGVEVHLIRALLNRDPLRKLSVIFSRTEATAARWDAQEEKASNVVGRLLDIADGIIQHIEACKKAGYTYTSLKFPRMKGDEARMTIEDAYMWLMDSRMLDTIQRAGATAARIAFDARYRLSEEQEIKSIVNVDSNSMTDTEIEQLIKDIEGSGRPLPYGFQQWKKAKGLPSGGGDGLGLRNEP